LSNTLSIITIGGNRYKLPDQGIEKASTNSAPWSGRREEYLGKWWCNREAKRSMSRETSR